MTSTGSQEPRPAAQADGCNHEWRESMRDEHVGMFMICRCIHCGAALAVSINRPKLFGWQRKPPIPPQDNTP